MTTICYLCGEEIKEVILSKDHVIPRQFITHTQPIVKGFDYGGKLPTHEKCNNEFGPETYSIKALKLISVLHDEENCIFRSPHKFMAINSECLKEFTQRDLKFFKFIDVRGNSIEDFSSPTFFSGQPKTIPKRDALFTALAVLTKSAAAILVSRHLPKIPAQWKVLAITYHGATESVDVVIDKILGDTHPFDVGVKLWLRPFDSGDWFVLYRAKNILVFFLFKFSDTDAIWNGMIEQFQDGNRLYFEGKHLNSLINFQWRKV